MKPSAGDTMLNSYTTYVAPRNDAVAVEYTAKGQRVTKTFPSMYKARSFYVAKCKQGAAPKVVKAQ